IQSRARAFPYLVSGSEARNFLTRTLRNFRNYGAEPCESAAFKLERSRRVVWPGFTVTATSQRRRTSPAATACPRVLSQYVPAGTSERTARPSRSVSVFATR